MRKILFSSLASIALISIAWFVNMDNHKNKHCVFRTLMNQDPVPHTLIFNEPAEVHSSVERALKWIKDAQQKNGGWGCGSHNRQNVNDPHAVPTDPATTAMVAMALVRAGSSLDKGPYKRQVKEATDYLLEVIGNVSPSDIYLTNTRGTQIQSKLGQNIDMVITTQYLTNILSDLKVNHPYKAKIEKRLEKCVKSIEVAMDDRGSQKGGTWAGVLQSSFANSALESAQALGIKVDGIKLRKSRDYLKGNYDANTEVVNAADGAGVILYSVTGSTRASAKEARKAETLIQRAKDDGILDEVVVNADNLKKIGLDEEDAMELNTAYRVYQSSKIKSQRKEVLNGFGNNGGEEFLSMLQTGESLVVNADNDWSNWYDNITSTLMSFQNNDGSWNGHHCITSPVFCTATCISILTINNDIEKLQEIGEN